MPESMTLKRLLHGSRLGIALAAAMVACGIAAAAGLALRPKVEIVMDRAALQARVEARLPFHGSKGSIRYTVTGVKVDIRPDGRVASDAVVSLTAMGHSAVGHLVGSGVLSYGGGSFYLGAFALEKASIHVGPPSTQTPTGVPRSSEEARAAAARRHLADMVTHFATGAQQEAEREVRESGSAVMAAVLDRYPVYTLRQGDFKRDVARLFLERVQVRDGNLVVTLDIVGGIVAILGWCAAVLLVSLGAVALAVSLGAGFPVWKKVSRQPSSSPR